MSNATETRGDLIIVRGLPGSGKSLICALLSEIGKYPVFSVDDYFTDEQGLYSFVHTENHKAYAHCAQRCLEAMQTGKPKIFLDNVFSMDWEMQPYFDMAESQSYRVHVLTAENRHGSNNVHGVTDEQLEKMAAKFKVKLY